MSREPLTQLQHDQAMDEARVLLNHEHFASGLEGLNDLSELINEAMHAKGFYDKPGEFGTRIALMHSELSEALENHRKGSGPDDHLPQYPGWQVEFADTIIRILDTCGEYQVPIGEILKAKMLYNLSRPYKHGKKY